MTCPLCNCDSEITRTVTHDDYTERERKCKACSYKWKTVEVDADMLMKGSKSNAEN